MTIRSLTARLESLFGRDRQELELDAEVPGVHVPKLSPGATVRVTRDNAPDLIGRVRQVSPTVDRSTQIGHVRIALTSNPSLKVGAFARASALFRVSVASVSL